LLVDALAANGGAVKSDRDEGVGGLSNNGTFLLCLGRPRSDCGEHAKAQQSEKDASDADEETE
jgi:hypothetical protein